MSHDTSKPLQAHPLAAVLPAMMRDEYVELVADIKANQLKQPIVLFEGKILDGRHRHQACIELGIEPKVETFTGTTDEAKAYVLSLNVHRRHLTLEQKDKIIASELKRDPTQSNRFIGKKAKVSHTHVAKLRKQAEAKGDVATVATSTDTRGRKQPRQRKPKAAKNTKPITVTVTPQAVQPAQVNSVWVETLERPEAGGPVLSVADSIAEGIVRALQSLPARDLSNPRELIEHARAELDRIEQEHEALLRVTTNETKESEHGAVH